MQLYSLIVTGPEARVDEAIDALLEARYDVRVRPGALIAYGDDPYSAAHAVESLGWRVEDRAAILDDVLLDIAA